MLKRLLALVALATGLISHAYGQTYPGQFPGNTVFGNTLGSTAAPVPGQVTNSQMATMGAGTTKGSVAGGSPQDMTGLQAESILQFLPSGANAVQRSLDSKAKDFVTVSDFGASGSSQNTTGTINASSTSLALAFAMDFANGQGIRVNHAGPAFTLAAPTGCTVTPQGAAGATTYQYEVATLDAAGGVGAATASFQTTTGNATLSQVNFNKIACTSAASATGYAVYRNISGTFTLVGIVFSQAFAFNDYNYGVGVLGAPDFLPSTAQVSSLADWLITSVVSGGGTTSLTLANSATTLATSQGVFHDDTVALNNAHAAFPYVIYKCGNYNVSSQITVSNANSAIVGSGVFCTTIQKISISADLFHFSGGNFNHVEKLLVTTSEYQNGGYIFDFIAGSSANNRIMNVDVVGGGNVVFFGSGGGQNIIDNFIFNSFNQNGISWASGFGGGDTVAHGTMNSECLINGGWGSGFGGGLVLQGGLTFLFANLAISCQQNPIWVQPAAGQLMSDIQFVNVEADGVQTATVSRVGGNNAWLFDGSNAGATLERIRCTMCWAGTMPTNGFVLLDVKSFVCSSCESYNNGQAGMQITTSDSINIVGSQFVHNSISSSGTFNGITAITNASKIMIGSSQMGVNSQFPTGTQQYGVQSDATVTNIALCNNVATGNLTGGYNINGVTAPTCTNQ